MTIQLVKVELSADVVAAMAEELEARGMWKEALFIAPVHHDPDLLSLMWMMGGRPIFMTAPEWRLRDVKNAVLVAADFAEMVLAARPKRR